MSGLWSSAQHAVGPRPARHANGRADLDGVALVPAALPAELDIADRFLERLEGPTLPASDF
jgi:hypothetical protein